MGEREGESDAERDEWMERGRYKGESKAERRMNVLRGAEKEGG